MRFKANARRESLQVRIVPGRIPLGRPCSVTRILALATANTAFSWVVGSTK
jgi:hypothetical protein